VLPDFGLTPDVWLAMHKDRRDLPRLRLVYDALATRLQALLRG
jgi:hypothetical protein